MGRVKRRIEDERTAHLLFEPGVRALSHTHTHTQPRHASVGPVLTPRRARPTRAPVSGGAARLQPPHGPLAAANCEHGGCGSDSGGGGGGSTHRHLISKLPQLAIHRAAAAAAAAVTHRPVGTLEPSLGRWAAANLARHPLPWRRAMALEASARRRRAAYGRARGPQLRAAVALVPVAPVEVVALRARPVA